MTKNFAQKLTSKYTDETLTMLQTVVAREIMKRDLQKRFDALVEEMNNNDFYIEMPDYVSSNFVVMDATVNDE